MDASSIFGGQNSIQYLVDQYMRLESMPKDKLIGKKKTINDHIKVLSDLDSKLSALKTKLDRMNDTFTDYFGAKSTTVSNADLFKATASAEATVGNHILNVNRLAVADTRVSNQFSNSASDFTAYSTDQTFSIEVASPTDEDPDNRVSIDVTVEAAFFSEDNESVLSAVRTAVNSAMDQAVADGVIKREERIHATVVSEEPGVSRLSFKSERSGYSYRMDFGASTLLDDLNINNTAQTSGTQGGYMYDVGTSHSTSSLNSEFVLDGLTFYRDSNSITDAVDGVTFQLLDTFASQETVTVNTDVEAVKEEVQSFIDSYNEVINFLRNNAQYNPATSKAGVLSKDLVYRNLSVDLRNAVMGTVSDVTYSEYDLLYDIGIEADQQGRLSISDEDKFTTALEDNSVYVSDLFKGSDGIANKVNDLIVGFTESGGTISSSKKQLNNEITTLNDRIRLMNDILDKKEKQLFEEFTTLQNTMYTLQSQQSFFSMFTSMNNQLLGF